METEEVSIVKPDLIPHGHGITEVAGAGGGIGSLTQPAHRHALSTNVVACRAIRYNRRHAA